MLKLILKTIMISIISSVLMVHDVVVFADTQGKATKGTDGVYSKTNTYDFNKTSASSDDVLGVITMFAVGYLGTKLLLYKKWTPDMTVAAAASGIYLVGEVMNILTAKKDMEKITASMTLRSDGAVDSTQVEYIKSLKESYQKVKEALTRKKMLQNIAMFGYLAAAGVASYQYFTEEGKRVSCEAALLESGTGLSTCAAGVYTSAECGPCLTIVKKLGADLKMMSVQSIPDAPSMAKEAATEPIKKQADANVTTMKCPGTVAPGLKATVDGACGAYLLEVEKNKSFGDVKSTLKELGSNQDLLNKILFPNQKIASEEKNYEQIFSIKKLLSKTMNLLIPNAEAGWVSLLGFGAGAALAFWQVGKSVNQWIDLKIFTPGGRILIWLGFTAATKIAIGVTEKKIKETDDNMAKIDKILNETNRLSKGVQNSNATITTVPTIATNFGTNSDVTLSSGAKTGCVEIASDSTSSSSSTSCASTATAFKSLSAIGDLPAALSTAASQVTSTADKLSNTGTLSGSTLASANSANANALGKLVKNQLAQLNPILAKNGKNPIDFDKSMAQGKNELLKATSDGLKNSKTNASGFLASIGSSMPSGSATDATPKTDESTLLPKAAKAAAEIGVKSGANQGLSLKLDDINGSSEAVLANGMKEGSAEDKYEIKENDINPDSKTSIFEVISIRYMKSGYPKLLEEETVK